MMGGPDEAAAVLAEIAAAYDADNGDGARDPHFTLDATDLAPRVASGQAVIVLNPPAVTIFNGASYSCEWKLVVASGRAHDFIATWRELSDVGTKISAIVQARLWTYGTTTVASGKVINVLEITFDTHS